MIAPAISSQPESAPPAPDLAQAAPTQSDQARRRQMQDAWKAYHGDFPKPLKVRANQPDDNVLSNRCAPIVDKGVSFLFGQILKIECIEEAGQGQEQDSPMQDFLDGLWGDDDDRMTLLAKMGVNGGVCGQVFVKLIPAQGRMQYPRLVVLDPQLIRVITPPDDCDLVLAYIIEFPGTNQWQQKQIIARVDPDGLAGVAGASDLDDTWTITNYCRKGQADAWFQTGEQEIWPYPFAPIFMCQNLPNPNETWGRPDLTPDLITMNHVLNFVQSNTSRILKFHAHPKTWGRGFRASQMSTAVDDVLVIEAPDGTLQNLEMHSDLASSLNFASTLRADMDEQSRVPAVALGRLAELPKGNISGVALALLFQPLIEKTVQKQRLYGCLIREISRAALVVAGLLDLEDYEDYPIGLHWQNLLPVDDLAAAQTALILQQLGVSQTTILQQLGYNPDEEADKTAAEEQKKLVQFSRGQGMPPAASGGAPATAGAEQQSASAIPAQDAAMQQEVGEGNE